MGKLILFGILGFAIYHFLISDETGCDAYASKYSCKYVVEKATYDVYYWFNVSEGDPKDEKLIGTVQGLSACFGAAVGYASRFNQKWSERSYICMLKKDGQNMEKHRYLGKL